MQKKESARCLSKMKPIKKLLEESEKLKERLSALNLCAEKLNSAENLNTIYELTLDAIERTLGFEDAAFMIVDKGYLREACQRGTSAPSTFELPLDETKRGITVRAALTRKPVLVSDIAKDNDYVRGVDREFSAKSELAVPVIAEDNVLGVLNIESRELDAFDINDAQLLQILASHASTAICNLKKRTEIERWGKQLALLMKSSAEMMSPEDLHHQLQVIVDAIQELGWRRVALSVRDENLNIQREEDIVTAGLTAKERKFLWTNSRSGRVWKKRLGQEFDRFKIDGFYYLQWSDPFVQKRFSRGTVSSHRSSREMADWDPDDLLYAPLRVANGRIMGVVSMDDPADGKKPTYDSLSPLNLFLNTAAEAIEKAHLHNQLTEYTERLEEKVLERTKELKKTQERLLKSERLASIGELAGMVGHDLRNPLAGIAGAIYYLKKKQAASDEKSEKMVKLIEEAIQHCNKIIDDLLDYSREIKLQKGETTPKKILVESISSLNVPENIIISDRTLTKHRINVDPEQIRKLFLNIIKNAFEAMPNGGTLAIESKKLKDSVTVSFSDTGTGMPDEVLANLWSPLFTTKARGMGFGLPISKRIIEAHGGTISAETSQNKGSTFTIKIPTHQKNKQDTALIINFPEHPLTRIEKTRNRSSQ